MLRPVILSAAILAGFSTQSFAADLTVSIIGAKPAQGQFLVSVFDRSETWMKIPVVSQTLNVAADGSSGSVFDLPAGTYAIALVHDANGNGKMDSTKLGFPSEAFGFSNGARARFCQPSFGKAAFRLTEPGTRLTISLERARR